MEDAFDISDDPPPRVPSTKTAGPVAWRDPRFQPAIDSVRRSCDAVAAGYEDDPFIGMCVQRNEC